VTGGTTPYLCSITSGTLPAGLSLNGCTVSGTPAAAGISNLTVSVTDSSTPQLSVSGSLSLTVVTPGSLILTSASLPNGVVGVAYSEVIGVAGGTGPYLCSITSGTLPAGLTLTGSTCTVSGTPAAAGTAALTVSVTDSSTPQQSVSGPLSVTVVTPGSLTLTTPVLPNGVVGTPYSEVIGVAGGVTPYTCAIDSGFVAGGVEPDGGQLHGERDAGGGWDRGSDGERDGQLDPGAACERPVGPDHPAQRRGSADDHHDDVAGGDRGRAVSGSD